MIKTILGSGDPRTYDSGTGYPLDLTPQTWTFITLNVEIKDFIKVVKSLGESDLLIKATTKKIENKTKEQRTNSLVFY